MRYQFHVLVEWDPSEDVWVTYVPALDNLSTYGETCDEALAMTEEAIQGYLEAAAKEGIDINPHPSHTELIQLEVAVS